MLWACLRAIVLLITNIYVMVIRGTPIVVHVMFIYFALPMMMPGVRVDAEWAAIGTLIINSGAYKFRRLYFGDRARRLVVCA